MKFKRFQAICAQMLEVDDEGNLMERHKEAKPRELHSLVLAYLGDAVFHLFIRKRLLAFDQHNVSALHAFSSQIVSAVYQAKAYKGIESMLTEEEKAVYRRARNTKSHTTRSASISEYHSSTGFEALLGTLYLNGAYERMEELEEAAFQVIVKDLLKKKK